MNKPVINYHNRKICVCSRCGEILKSASILRQHNLIEHSITIPADKPYHCNLCLKLFESVKEFEAHEAGPLCVQNFDRKVDDIFHRKVDGLFQCEKCKKIFVNSTGLNEHVKTKHFIELDSDEDEIDCTPEVIEFVSESKESDNIENENTDSTVEDGTNEPEYNENLFQYVRKYKSKIRKKSGK